MTQFDHEDPTECAAILDVYSRLALAESEPLDRGRQLLFRIVSMLTQIIRRRDE